MREDELDRVCRQGQEAWKNLQNEQNYNDWIKVGEALQIGRTQAMAEAGVNTPSGKGYNIAFGKWLKKYQLDTMDSGDRTRLFDIMANKVPIEEWRSTLPLTERLKLNHPNSIWRKWKAREQAKKPKDPNKPTLTDVNIQLQEQLDASKREIEGLKAHAAELEAARTTPTVEAALPVDQLDALFDAIWNSVLDDGEGKALDPKQAKQRKNALFGFRGAWQKLRGIVEQQAAQLEKAKKPKGPKKPKAKSKKGKKAGDDVLNKIAQGIGAALNAK